MTIPGYEAGANPEHNEQGRGPLRYLLHALNQPLTALQCSLELSLSRPNHTERDLQTLNEALEFTSRMRILVEALHQVAETPNSERNFEAFSLDRLVRDLISELLPVAESKRVRIQILGETDFSIRANRSLLVAALFRFIDAVLGMMPDRGDLKILGLPDSEAVCLVVSWNTRKPPAHTEFSPQELALLTSQCGLRQAGAVCDETRNGQSCTCTLRLPLDGAVKHERARASI